MIKLMPIAFFFIFATAQPPSSTKLDINMSQAWGFAFLTTLSLSILGLVAALLIVALKRCISENSFKIFINMLYSLGCGAMVGDAMIHILPDNYKSP
jgi:hypothetical protein